MKYTVLRPISSWEPHIIETLDSTFFLKGDYEIIFCADRDSAVVSQARILCRTHGTGRVVTGPSNILINPKLSNLDRGWRRAKGAWVVMVDSNVLMPPDTFQRIEAAWVARTGLVSAPAIGARPETFWAEVECAFLSYQARWQILADMLGIGFAQGKVMCCGKEQFERWGGLEALDAQPAEDAAATKMVRNHGRKVRLPSKLFEQLLGQRSLKQIWDRQLRWAKLRRHTFQFLYFLELFTTLAPTMVGFYFFPFATVAMLLLGYLIENLYTRWKGWYWSWRTPFAMLTRDILLLGIWTKGWFGNDFTWDGKSLFLSQRDEKEKRHTHNQHHTAYENGSTAAERKNRPYDPNGQGR
jgi:ceramide glucosyltransferase